MEATEKQKQLLNVLYKQVGLEEKDYFITPHLTLEEADKEIKRLIEEAKNGNGNEQLKSELQQIADTLKEIKEIIKTNWRG